MNDILFAIAISIVNALLSLALLSIYYKNYTKMKSKFSLGLLFFAGFFVLQGLVAAYLQFFMSGSCARK